uniref:PiggyBac transposable element-derived protein domain-containing protein n=1 Tax=Trichuris muris TaxID=70415 RepID=A0A5S6Q9C2_TRIMR
MRNRSSEIGIFGNAAAAEKLPIGLRNPIEQELCNRRWFPYNLWTVAWYYHVKIFIVAKCCEKIFVVSSEDINNDIKRKRQVKIFTGTWMVLTIHVPGDDVKISEASKRSAEWKDMTRLDMFVSSLPQDGYVRCHGKRAVRLLVGLTGGGDLAICRCFYSAFSRNEAIHSIAALLCGLNVLTMLS